MNPVTSRLGMSQTCSVNMSSVQLEASTQPSVKISFRFISRSSYGLIWIKQMMFNSDRKIKIITWKAGQSLSMTVVATRKRRLTGKKKAHKRCTNLFYFRPSQKEPQLSCKDLASILVLFHKVKTTIIRGRTAMIAGRPRDRQDDKRSPVFSNLSCTGLFSYTYILDVDN